MFNWFKRPSEPKRPERAVRTSQQRRYEPSRPVAVQAADAVLPEVVAEGNTEADWSAWEDSQMAWDSQLQTLQPSERVFIRDPQPSQLDEIDAFASVQRKRDL